jgi:hypothetical protein
VLRLPGLRKAAGARRVGPAATVWVLLAPQTVLADDEEVELVRWDLITVIQGLVLAGSDKVKDAVSGEVVMQKRNRSRNIRICE